MSLLLWTASIVTRSPAKELACPVLAFRPISRNRGKFPPSTSAAPAADSGQLAVSRRGRCCHGASLASMESIGTELTVRDSPM
jgi:hypothetical protein